MCDCDCDGFKALTPEEMREAISECSGVTPTLAGRDEKAMTATELMRINKEYSEEYAKRFQASPLGIYLDGMVKEAVDRAMRLLREED